MLENLLLYSVQNSNESFYLNELDQQNLKPIQENFNFCS